MGELYHESEHQELFVPNAELHRPIPLHIPSALGNLGYFVCLRVDAAWPDALDDVVTHLVVGGLRPDDVTLAAGEGGDGPGRYPSTAPGRVWRVLCRARVSRGDATLTLSNLPAGLTTADVLLTTWPRFITSGQADDWLACQADPAWAPGGVPLGGIGAGKVELCRDGRFRNFSGNNNQDMPFEEPDGLAGAHLAVACDGDERLLASRAADGAGPCDALEADLAFPQVTLRAPGVFDGIDVTVAASAPLVPHNLERSSLPGFVLRWHVRNHRPAAADVVCRLAWPNLVGAGGGIGTPETSVGYADGSYRFWEAEDAPTAEIIRGRRFVALRYGNDPSPVCAAADGAHYVAVRAGDGEARVDEDPRRGSVAAAVTVPAGGEQTLDMAVVWEMPHWIGADGVDRGLYWQNHHADGMSVVAALLDECDEILAEAGALAGLLARTDLPEWMRRRLLNCCYPLITNSVLLADGRFSINEGPTEMAGCYGTIDQRLAAHPATLLLQPELNARELGEFAAVQADNGGMNHDLGHGHLESGPQDRAWPDLTCSFILQTARHAWATGDAAFESAMWPRARKALLRHKEWADAGGGVAQVGQSGLGTSYDGYHYEGTTPYMATLWIAALAVMRKWARRHDDGEVLAMIDPLIDAATARIEADLWNGRYYRAFGSPDGPANDNCHAGMLAGQFYARALAGQDVLPPERLAACADALTALNGSERFAIPPDEVGPDGESGCEFGWLPYVESFCLAALGVLGDARMPGIWRRVIAAMDAGGQRCCDTRLMYQPVSGEPSWGSYYMTAPASWLVYESMLDFAYSPDDGVLRLCPTLAGRFALVHPLFWALATRDGARLSLTIERVFSQQPLTIRAIEVPRAAGGVTVAGEALKPTGGDGVYRRFVVGPITLDAGVTVAWETAG